MHLSPELYWICWTYGIKYGHNFQCVYKSLLTENYAKVTLYREVFIEGTFKYKNDKIPCLEIEYGNTEIVIHSFFSTWWLLSLVVDLNTNYI